MSSDIPAGEHKKPPIPTPAKRIPAFNIDKRPDRLYEIEFLHKWFAISSLLLFLFTIVMVLADYSREWKRYQREFNRLSLARTNQDITEAVGSIPRDRYNAAQQQYQQALAAQQQRQAEIDQIQDRLDDLNADYFAVNQNYQTQKAYYDSEKYDYEEALAAQASNVDSLSARLAERKQGMDEYQAERDRLDIERRGVQAQLSTLVGARDQAQAELETLLADYTRLQTRANTLNPGLVVTSFRNAPIFDMLNSSEKVNQILLSNLFIDQPFKSIPRVDRCTTCHLGIDQAAYANAPQPFKTHPRMDLFLASNSQHPIESFGCTSCHGGLDRAVDFQTAGHSPRNEEQQRQWEARYGWHHEEFLETPMLSMNHVEAGCYKCHNGGPDVPGAANLNNGRDLIRIYGCFGCHRIPGYENVKKVGPDLSTVSGKLTKDWVKKWLVNPKDFKSEARMPKFWYNSNNSGPEWEARNQTEISAVTEFLWSKSTPKTLPAGRTTGNADRGKQLLETVGCFGCHAVGPIQETADRSQTRRRHGYNLAAQGSKVSASWIYNWVKDPTQVWADSKMPSLRLTDDEAADVTAYVFSQKNTEWEQRPAPQIDAAALDTIVVELLRAGSTEIEAREKLATMTPEQKTLFAGERLVGRYGCYACHNIPNFENAQPIGTELTEAGSKLLSQLDFGFLPIEHSRAEWYEAKLKDPRIFDVGRVKRPEELLKMPNFQFSDREVDSITMVLTSMVKDRVPMEMKDTNSSTAAIAEGRQLIAEKNCRGCHIIEGAGGDIRGVIAEPQWPPNLATQGFKTQPLWLHPFLKDPNQIKLRPWLTARMPTFHFDERETGIIGRYFSALDNVDYPFIDVNVAATTNQQKLAAGAELFRILQCESCHPTSNVLPPNKDPADLAPNLQLASQRLRPEWVVRWLQDPQRIVPGTRMPTFYQNGQSQVTNILGGDMNAQIEAMRDHLFITVGGGRRPSGLTSTNR